MLRKSFALVALVPLSVLTLSANAALYDRGDGLIYDDVLDITWLQDANYAHTSGYAAANATGDENSTPANIQVDGGMGWEAANAWAAGLSYGGYDDWRLPSVGSAPTFGYDVTTGELGYMFYTNLGNTSGTPIIGNVSFTEATPGGGTESFLNVQSYVYWYGEEYTPDPLFAWAFPTNNGRQGNDDKDGSYYGWAVRDGDVSQVPVPAAAWLFASALAGLFSGGRMRKKAA